MRQDDLTIEDIDRLSLFLESKPRPDAPTVLRMLDRLISNIDVARPANPPNANTSWSRLLNNLLRFGARTYGTSTGTGGRYWNSLFKLDRSLGSAMELPTSERICYLIPDPEDYGLRIQLGSAVFDPLILPGLIYNLDEPSQAEQVALDTLRGLIHDYLAGDVPAGTKIGLSHGRFGFSNATSIPVIILWSGMKKELGWDDTDEAVCVVENPGMITPAGPAEAAGVTIDQIGVATAEKSVIQKARQLIDGTDPDKKLQRRRYVEASKPHSRGSFEGPVLFPGRSISGFGMVAKGTYGVTITPALEGMDFPPKTETN